jgi:hypothetical protein
MGMYTEFYFRANVKDGPVADWLHTRINFLQEGGLPFDEHEFFQSDRWTSVLWGGGAVYQESRSPIFRRKDEAILVCHHTLVVASSLKNYGGEIDAFFDWIDPHLEMCDGEFLGYSLYEDSADDGDNWREHPTLYFHNRKPVSNA